MKIIRTKGRGAQQTAELLAALEERGGAALDAVLPAVKRIVADVRKQGDRALLRYAAQFDGLSLARRDACASRPKRWPLRGRPSRPRCKRGSDHRRRSDSRLRRLSTARLVER
jgi:predicted RNA polymerase sigma factor